jgi:predicted permease
MNVVLAEAYGTEPDEVAATILLGTLASFVAVPAVLAFVV